ncbi:MAG TPA: hypothetical protein VJX72_11795 [Candidatus Acidoferrum sp.]|nr:hypothetical protein [Candidatus Acidoferrum sp.]
MATPPAKSIPPVRQTTPGQARLAARDDRDAMVLGIQPNGGIVGDAESAVVNMERTRIRIH